MSEPGQTHSALWSVKVHEKTKAFFFFKELYDTAIGGEWIYAGDSSNMKQDINVPNDMHFSACDMPADSDFCDPRVVKRYHHCLRDDPNIFHSSLAANSTIA